jgi:transketolase
MNSEQLKNFARDIRVDIVESIRSIGVGHIGGCLSIADLLAVLYGKHMNIDPQHPDKKDRDRLVCSKGHAGPAIYAVLAEKGYFPKEELLTLNKGGTHLPSHCDMNKTVGVDMTAGSLGQGFSCAVGMAIGSRIAGDGATIYAIIGDGESQEGQIWEAAMYAGTHNLGNLIAFTDYNKMQLDNYVSNENDVYPLADKWKAFNWNVIDLKDGNDVDEIDRAITEAKTVKNKPTMIILNTVKGKGVKIVEDAKVGSHSMTITDELYASAMKDLGR